MNKGEVQSVENTEALSLEALVPNVAERAEASGNSISLSLTSMTAGISSSLLPGMMNFFFLMVLDARRVRVLAASFMLESGTPRISPDFSSLMAKLGK